MLELPYVSMASGIQDHRKSWHMASLAICFLTSAAKVAAPTAALASFMVTEETIDVTVTSKATGFHLSQPKNKNICRAGVEMANA